MSELKDNTLSAYLGPEFQQRLMWQLLVEPEFAEKIIPNLAIEYFDDPNLKRLFIIILEYFKEFDKVPNLQNQSIHQAINKYKTPNSVIEEESLFGVIKRIELWNDRVINKSMYHDGDVVQKSTNSFIKQQEYRKLAESIIEKVKNGTIKNKVEIGTIEEKFQKITHIGEEADDCEDVTDGIDKALMKEFRKTIPTGIGVIDSLTGGGLGKGEIGVILTPSGVGKTTLLTVIADTAYQDEKNVAQIIFEDTKDQIKRKHYVIWADSALSKLDEDVENERVSIIIHNKAQLLKNKGRLIIKKFSQENTTMLDVRNWMLSYQKKYGFKFDILVLDYLDCLESHKKSPDRNEAELAIIKGFEALASDFDIPAWTAIQSNRSGFGAEFVDIQQSGGSIKRIQKAHFFMSVAKTQEQKEASLANIQILKARFAQDGQKFTDCIFNNDTMQIIITDPKYPYVNKLKKNTDVDVEHLNSKANQMHVAISQHTEGAIMERLNDDGVNGKALSEYSSSELNSLMAKTMMSEPVATTSQIPPNKEFDGIILDESTDFHPEKEFHDEQTKATEGINDGVNDGVSEGAVGGAIEGAIGEILEINGDVTTVNPDDIVEEKPIILDKIQEELTPKPEIVEKNKTIDMDDFEFTDPDAPQEEEGSVADRLKKMRENQNVIKKV